MNSDRSVPSDPPGRRWLARFVPGMLVAATGVGAGDLLTAGLAGSRFGLTLLWAAWLGAVLKWFLNEGIARWQMATGTTLVEGWITHLGRWVSWAFGAYMVAWAVFTGGALASACGVAGTGNFANRIDRLKKNTLSYLSDKKRFGKKIFGFGAPVKGNTLLNYFGVGTQYLDCLVEKNELRRGLFSPGMHIPIVIEKELTRPADIYFVLAWNFRKEILENSRHLLDQRIEFYFPVNPKEIS